MTLLRSTSRAASSSLLVLSGADDRTGCSGKASDDALAPDVALVVTEHGDGCIVDLNGSVYAVSPVAAAMLRDTFEHGRDAAITRNADRYGVDENRVASDLDAFLGGMAERGLLQRRQTRRPIRARRILAGAVASVMHRLLRVAGTPRARAWFALTLARLSFVTLGWNPTVKAWQKRLCRERKVLPGSRAQDLAQAIDGAVRSAAARHMMNVDCKERALACFALARCAGLPATLVVGVEFYPLAGHSWCETGSAVIGDEESNCKRFTPAFRYS
jgi:hypothetical protein